MSFSKLNNTSNPTAQNSSVILSHMSQDLRTSVQNINISNPSTFLTQVNRIANTLYITLKALEIPKRSPVFIIIKLDTSGSMGSAITSSSSSSEFNSFTRLDIAIHSINTIMASLDSNDIMCIIEYNTNATVLVKPTEMSVLGKKVVKKALEQLEPNGTTNIYDALNLAYEHAKTDYRKDRKTIGILLTDGEPCCSSQYNTSASILEGVQKNLIDNVFDVFLTFGFGNEIDSFLLENIGNRLGNGNGMFGFIPDYTMLGTVIINLVSAAFATIPPSVDISITLTKNDKVYKKILVPVKMVLSGSSRQFIVDIGNEPKESIHVLYKNQSIINPLPSVITNELNVEIVFQKILTCLKELCQHSTPYDIRPVVFAQIHKLLDSVEHDRINKLTREFLSVDPQEAQVFKAFENINNWQTWGRHYMKAFLQSHNYNICYNFKDPSGLDYCYGLHSNIRTTFEEIFVNIPPPIGSMYTPPTNQYRNQLVPSTPQPVDMRNMYDASGGCYGGNTIIPNVNGAPLSITKVCIGDIIKNTDGGEFTVKALVITYANTLIEITNSCSVTPEHPIMIWTIDTIYWTWVYPHTLVDNVSVFKRDYPEGTKVYNLVLQKNIPSIQISLSHQGNSIQFDTGTNDHSFFGCTLAHNTHGPVIEHPLWGTDYFVELCKSLDCGWPYVDMSKIKIVRRDDGMAINLIKKPFVFNLENNTMYRKRTSSK